MPIKPTLPIPSNSAESALIQQAMSDLSHRLSVSKDQLSLVEFKNVVWPNAGLGCPHPDMAYKQVQQDGYRILLQYGNRTFAYHGGGKRGPFLCENPGAGRKMKSPPPGFGNV
ncbi:MAG: hypothetical protein DWQ04_07540 [Chloroflexi bacterium]|nr:MAG: hypothetical protein DWQ04_07540 [Chloroflexota bacterium]